MQWLKKLAGDDLAMTGMILKSALYFILAGLCEIAGGYLVWQWLREDRSFWFAVAGSLLLVLYGVVPTFQPAHFGRVYAAYGGVFIALAVLWGWCVDGVEPDRYDVVGVLIAIIGVVIIMYWPRD